MAWKVWGGLDHIGSYWPLLRSGLLFSVEQEPQESFRKNSDRIWQAGQAAVLTTDSREHKDRNRGQHGSAQWESVGPGSGW